MLRSTLFFVFVVSSFLACSSDPPLSSPASKASTTSGSVASDLAALVALYHATGGESWIVNDHWLSNKPLDEWVAVFVNTKGRVDGLWLTGNGLRGSIPPQIEDLEELEILYLDRNQLSGTIPPELGNLRNLKSLALRKNQLSGTIPPKLGNLTKLERLELDNNQLSGPIPPELGQLTNLKKVTIGGNQLTGCLPSAWRDVRVDQSSDLGDLGLDFCGEEAWPTGDFNIELVFVERPGDEELSPADKDVFQRAVKRWEQVILNDMPPVNYTHQPKSEWSSFLQTRIEVQDVVDDLRVFVRIMDLGENIAGSSTVTWVRTDGNVPILAEMAIAPGYKNDFSLIMHELAHCLGFDSSMWEDFGLLNARDNTFSGALTRIVFLILAGGTYQDRYVPLVDGAHWDGGILGDELMISGWVWPYEAPLSIVTLAAMSDMGYEVNLEAADTYFLPKLAAAKPLVESPMRCHIQRRPIRVADANGQEVKIIQP